MTLPEGIPLFPRPVPACNALNASPYVVDFAMFESAFAFNAHRRALFAAARDTLAAAAAAGAEPLALLVGGGFVDRRKEAPKDLDCICFFRGDASVTAALMDVQQGANRACVDLRFVPVHPNPILALKACAFFATLYSVDRASREAAKGSVLIDIGSVE